MASLILTLDIMLFIVISFMTHFLPSLSWAEERSIYPTFSFVLKSLGKLFRKYQAEPPVGKDIV